MVPAEDAGAAVFAVPGLAPGGGAHDSPSQWATRVWSMRSVKLDSSRAGEVFRIDALKLPAILLVLRAGVSWAFDRYLLGR